jgi:hypothetical protein
MALEAENRRLRNALEKATTENDMMKRFSGSDWNYRSLCQASITHAGARCDSISGDWDLQRSRFVDSTGLSTFPMSAGSYNGYTNEQLPAGLYFMTFELDHTWEQTSRMSAKA